MSGLEIRYDPLADALTVVRHFDAVHTATAAAHDSVVTMLRDATGAVTGVTLHEARSMMVVDWALATRAHGVPDDLADAVMDWLREHSLARPWP